MYFRQSLNPRIASIALLCGLIASESAHGGTIGSYDGAVGGGTATVNGMYDGPISTLYPNDAEPGGAGGPSRNVLDVSKVFNNLTPIDMTFTVNNSGGVTSYLFEEDVTNNTGFHWWDYHFVLGVGVGAAFVPFAPGSLVEFDPTNLATTDSFANGVQGAVTVDWWGAPGVPIGGVALFNVQILTFDIAPPDTSYTFTLRQYPTIPEPTSLVLLGVGVFGIAGLRLRSCRF